MKTLIIVAFEFPPLNSGGSHRPFRLAKSFVKCGFEVIVITPEPQAHNRLSLEHSYSSDIYHFKELRTPLNATTRFQRIKNSHYFNTVGTEASRWRNHVFNAILQIQKNNSVAAVIVTIPPFSLARLAVQIKERFNLPVILDMRDAWSQWTIAPYASYIHYRATLREEYSTLKKLDAIVLTSKKTLDDLLRIHPALKTKKMLVVHNAFEDLPSELPTTIQLERATLERPLTIGYVGSFYYTPYQRSLIFNPWWRKKPYQWFQYIPRQEDWLYRSPYYFFKSLSVLFETLPEYKSLIRVDFAGEVPVWLRSMAAEFGLEEIVNFKGPVPHSESLDFQKSVDILLITSSKVINGADYSIAGKTFEYLSMFKPILGFVCDGAQSDLLSATKIAVMCKPDDSKFSSEVIKDIVSNGCKLKPDIPEILKYHIKETTRVYVDLINELTDGCHTIKTRSLEDAELASKQ